MLWELLGKFPSAHLIPCRAHLWPSPLHVGWQGATSRWICPSCIKPPEKGVGQPPGNAGAIVVAKPGLDTPGSSHQDMPTGEWRGQAVVVAASEAWIPLQTVGRWPGATVTVIRNWVFGFWGGVQVAKMTWASHGADGHPGNPQRWARAWPSLWPLTSHASSHLLTYVCIPTRK